MKSYGREFSFLAKALRSTDHPVLAHIIPMRRCNLACTYCNEYDHTSQPVPLDVMKRRLDSWRDPQTLVSDGHISRPPSTASGEALHQIEFKKA